MTARVPWGAPGDSGPGQNRPKTAPGGASDGLAALPGPRGRSTPRATAGSTASATDPWRTTRTQWAAFTLPFALLILVAAWPTGVAYTAGVALGAVVLGLGVRGLRREWRDTTTHTTKEQL